MDFQENSKAIYLQLADKLCNDIIAGSLQPDSRIPSVREFAATVQVNANTVARTYDHLQQAEIIYNKRGIGYFVSTGACERIKQERMDRFINNEAKQLFHELSLLGITPQQLHDMYEAYYNLHN